MITRESRAKQFLPFDALTGLREALMEKEEEYIDRIELSEEECEKISETLSRIEENTYVKLIYYQNRKYHNSEGNVLKINPIRKYLKFEDRKIYFVDILELEIV